MTASIMNVKDSMASLSKKLVLNTENPCDSLKYLIKYAKANKKHIIYLKQTKFTLNKNILLIKNNARIKIFAKKVI